MSKATVTVQYVNEPKGKGPASIKDTNGTYYKFWTREFPTRTFVKGGTYDLELIDNEYNGKPDPIIKSVTPSNGNGSDEGKIVQFLQGNEFQRSARIERQSALKVAGVLVSALIDKGKATYGDSVSLTVAIAEQFETFIQAAGTVPATSETTAPVDKGVEL